MNHQVTEASELTLSGYQMRLPAYEGPLDVLLRLIERSQLAIEDVSLVAVMNQFFDFIARLEQSEPLVIAEFTAVGSRLTVLKTRSLLPRPQTLEDETAVSDLTVQLRDYKRLKDVANHLGTRHSSGLASFAPIGRGVIAQPVANGHTRLSIYAAETLARSIRRRLSAVPRAARVISHRRVVSLRELIDHVAAMVTAGRSTSFSSIVANYASRTEVATAFLAVLVLVRRGELEATQSDLFADVSLSRVMSSDAPTDSSPDGDDIHFA